MTSRRIQPTNLYFGTPIALVSTLNENGTTNLSPMSSVWALGDRLVLGLGVAGQALLNLQRVGECVINLPDASLWPQVEALAPTTGRHQVPAHKVAMGYRNETDKFSCSGLTPARSDTVTPDRIEQCPLQIEASLCAVHRPTAEDTEASGWRIVEVQVRCVHAHESILLGERVNVNRWKPLLYLFRHYVAAGERVGQNFRATD